MKNKEIAYKHGAWRIKEAEESIFDKYKLMLSVIEKVKIDIENIDPNDKKAQGIINDLLYHYCWKIAENDDTNN